MAHQNKGLIRRIKQHIIAKEHRFFAVVQPGFEWTARRELENLGIEHCIEIIEGGIEFSSKLADCYRVNMCSRTINRLFMRLAKFRVDQFEKLRKKIEQFPWELYLANGTSVFLKVTCKKSRLYHTGRVAAECQSGVETRLKKYNLEVSFSGKTTVSISQLINVRIDHDMCQISLDTSGEHLYKRGSKTYVTQAPLRESTAALILLEARLPNYDILLDPMCGSGTFSIEGAGIFLGQYPNIERDFAFQRWPCFRPRAFKYLQKKFCEAIQIPVTGKKIYTADIDKNSIDTTAKNLEHCGLLRKNSVNSVCNEMKHPGIDLDLQQQDFFDALPAFPGKKCLIVLNPPYGARLHATDTGTLYRRLGNTIRRYNVNCGYAIITPGLEYEKILSLPYDRKILFFNGGIKVAVIFKDYCGQI